MSGWSKSKREISEKVDKEKDYPIEEAISLLKELSKRKFKESFDISINLGVDPKKSDQVVRGATNLPHGNGKEVRVAVIAQGSAADEAKEAGAELVGFEELAESIKRGEIDFDLLIATPDAMRLVGQLGKVLGPKGLMPNPKTGTVTDDVAIKPGTNISITRATSDEITINNTQTLPNVFGTIAVAGQSSILADSTTDTLTIAGGNGITVTTDANSDTLTISTSTQSLFETFTADSGTTTANSGTDTLTISGGTGIYYSANQIFIISKSQEKEGAELAGWKFTINIEKSRYVKEKSKLPFTVLYDSGIQKWSSLFELALEGGWLAKATVGWYNVVDRETGEILGSKRRLKDIEQDDEFFEGLIADKKFNEFVERKFKLTMVEADSAREDDTIESDSE